MYICQQYHTFVLQVLQSSIQSRNSFFSHTAISSEAVCVEYYASVTQWSSHSDWSISVCVCVFACGCARWVTYTVTNDLVDSLEFLIRPWQLCTLLISYTYTGAEEIYTRCPGEMKAVTQMPFVPSFHLSFCSFVLSTSHHISFLSFIYFQILFIPHSSSAFALSFSLFAYLFSWPWSSLISAQPEGPTHTHTPFLPPPLHCSYPSPLFPPFYRCFLLLLLFFCHSELINDTSQTIAICLTSGKWLLYFGIV